MGADDLFQIDYKRCLRGIRVNIVVISVFTLLCASVGILACFIVMDSGYGFNDMHEAVASVYSRAGSYYGNEAAVVRYAETAKSLRVAEAAARLLGVPYPDKDEIHDMTEVYYGDNGPYSAGPAVVYISVRHPEPSVALNTANAVAKAFASEVLAIDGDSAARVLDAADSTEKLYTAYGMTAIYAVASGVFGFVVACAAASFLAISSPRFDKKQSDEGAYQL